MLSQELFWRTKKWWMINSLFHKRKLFTIETLLLSIYILMQFFLTNFVALTISIKRSLNTIMIYSNNNLKAINLMANCNYPLSFKIVRLTRTSAGGWTMRTKNYLLKVLPLKIKLSFFPIFHIVYEKEYIKGGKFSHEYITRCNLVLIQ